MYIISGHWTFAHVHRLIACHILNVIPDVSLESLMCSTLLPYNDDGILVYFTIYIVTIKLSLLLPVSYFWHCIVIAISVRLAIWRCCRLSLSKFLCHVFVASRYFCEMYLLFSIFINYYVCVACNLHNGLILLRLIKHRRDRSACVWGRMSWCLRATQSPAPPFLLIISHGCYGSCINYFCPIMVRALAHANGSPLSCHLHRP